MLKITIPNTVLVYILLIGGTVMIDSDRTNGFMYIPSIVGAVLAFYMLIKWAVSDDGYE